MGRLDKKIVLVTGGASVPGLGSATAERLAQEGAYVYVTDIDDFPAVNIVYASYFHPPYPARAFVQVAKLLRGAKVEISAAK